jgi:acyl-CoA thioesterase-1
LKILMTLSLVAAMAAPSRAAAVAPAPDRIAHALKIVAFGDSLTSGHRLGPNSAYPSILESRLKTAGLPFTVVNKGISGDTSGRALRRLKAALDERPQILIVALGANDGLTGVPVAQLRRNLEEIITTAQTQGVQVLLCGMEALPLYGWQYTVEFHQVYPGLAQKYQVPLVPFLLDRVIGNADLMSSDGIHPNAEGARVLADNIWPYLRPLAEAAVKADAGV